MAFLQKVPVACILARILQQQSMQRTKSVASMHHVSVTTQSVVKMRSAQARAVS